jgi:hypothetical protein
VRCIAWEAWKNHAGRPTLLYVWGTGGLRVVVEYASQWSMLASGVPVESHFHGFTEVGA